MTRTIFFLFLLSLVVVPFTGCGGGSENAVDLTPVEETPEQLQMRADEEKRQEAESRRED